MSKSTNQTNMFNLDNLFRKESKAYIVLPELHILKFDFFKLILEIINYYEHTTFICNKFELSFYKILFEKSNSLESFKDKINFDFYHTLTFKHLITQDCLIFDFFVIQGRNKPDFPTAEHHILKSFKHKRAIYCALNEYSDINFTEQENKQKPETKDLLTANIEYTKKLLNFINHSTISSTSNGQNNIIPFNHSDILKSLNNINLSEKTIINSSNLINKKINQILSIDKNIPINVVYLKKIINEFKINSFLKKNNIKEFLIVISKHFNNNNFITSAITTKLQDNNKIILINDYDFTDILSLELIAKSISYNEDMHCRTIISNLRINLNFFSVYKNFSNILFEISEPIYSSI
ncbi:MAG: hypothetical protein M0Q94_11085 [Candidatus Cloacimonetes bacterium]|nr:hypothetical protein [Candidatus Cloacimonadota bacterium]